MTPTLFDPKAGHPSPFSRLDVGSAFYSARDNEALWVKTSHSSALVIAGTDSWPTGEYDEFHPAELVRFEGAPAKLIAARRLYLTFRDEHFAFTRQDWQRRIAEGKTDLGYWEWVQQGVSTVDLPPFRGWSEELRRLTTRETNFNTLVALYQDGFSPAEACTYLTM